jgi:hypothetical protein
MVNRGGVEPLGPRVKSPLPGHPGLEGSRSAGSPFVFRAHVSYLDVGPSSRERSAVSRLSAERSAFELRKEWCVFVESNHAPLACRASVLPLNSRMFRRKPVPDPIGDGHRFADKNMRHRQDANGRNRMVPLQGFEPRVAVCKTAALGR